MLFDVEKQAAQRWIVEAHRICEGCPYFGMVSDEPPFCIMRQNPPECTIAGITGKSGTLVQENC